MTGDGLIPLPPPSAESLEAAAKAVLGSASEASLGDDGARLFCGMDQRIFVQAAGESAGLWLGDDNVAPELKDRILSEAGKVRRAALEAERAGYLDPAKNEMIRTPD